MKRNYLFWQWFSKYKIFRNGGWGIRSIYINETLKNELGRVMQVYKTPADLCILIFNYGKIGSGKG